jgi:hypothetical protein
VQDIVHEVAGGVSGERATGAVGSVRTRSEAKDVDAGVGVSETGNGLGPVLLIAIGGALDYAEVLSVCTQARAEGAADNGLLDGFEDGERED